ncbi:MAG: LysM peptidoglycan-binding domain-containing protein [Flavobacterium sp.]|nr:LysM peptidoglycan-binding domain-containing protein [Flavobacterium sp.]
MTNKIVLLLLGFLLYSCGSNRSIVQVTIPVTKHATAQVKKKSTPVNKHADKPSKPVVKAATSEAIEKRYEAAIEQNKSTENSTVVSKSEILEATTRVKVTTEMVLAYIDQYDEIAKSNMIQYGIPASIILGQGILESGAGTGPLSVLANNHFGIKCHKEWTGPSVKYDDDAAQECFRKYEHSNQSYQDHSLFLTSRPRYKGLFALEKGDYKQWAIGLKAAGYATDPKYTEKLTGIIERYQLQRFDAEVLGVDYVPTNLTTTTTNALAQTSSASTYTVMPGDTLYSISKKFNLSVDELRAKNGLADNTLSIGQTLLIN